VGGVTVEDCSGWLGRVVSRSEGDDRREAAGNGVTVAVDAEVVVEGVPLR